ncbi:hypothetical protein RN51_01205 [Microbacterium oxydans]|uniref:DUF2142 domain-containing protein n=1 Tax=Microbacterium oxydans TaxID=82380 RepID=A0A0F0KV97_9MICO|nr:DUF2142 domain-containing protein [Microbacterium oxydans]KJL24040.1 hypothetical protein RN51_01205 [Microbacterium oxydans]
MHSSAQRRRAVRIVTAVLVPLLAFLTLLSWSLSSAVGSSPDDDFHLASIWCGLGEREGLCELPPESVLETNPTYRLVPASIPNATCYAFLPDESADCWDPDQSGMAVAKRANVEGLYPRVFYAAMSVFASEDVVGSVVQMRIVNSAFAVALISVTFFLLPRRLRPALIISVVASCVPLGLFLYASANPSSWALLSAAVVWIALYGAFVVDSRPRRISLTALALFAGIIGAGARADAAIYAAFAVVLAVFLGMKKSKAALLPAAGGLALIVLAGLFYVTSGQSAATVTGIAAAARPLTTSEHVANLLNVPNLWAGALGGWGLGWLDTLLPAAVPTIGLLVVGGVLLVGMAEITWRRALTFIAALAAFWIVPFALLATSNAVVGTQVQPRYIMPLLIILLAVAAASPATERIWTGARVALMGAALAFTASISLHYNIRRYTTGHDIAGIDPGREAEWWWPVAPSPFAVWVGGTIAFTVLLGIFWIMTVRPDLFRAERTVSALSQDQRETVSEA